jgi:hypothetical protein
VVLPANLPVVRSDVLLREPENGGPGACDVVAKPAGEWKPIAPLTLPTFAATEAEGIASAAAGGWSIFAQPRFSGGGALLGTQPEQAVSITIPELAPGQYWVDVRIYDYSTGSGTIQVALNGIEQQAAWGSSVGTPGVARVTLLVTTTAPGKQLSVTFERGGQTAVLVDAIAVISEDPGR